MGKAIKIGFLALLFWWGSPPAYAQGGGKDAVVPSLPRVPSPAVERQQLHCLWYRVEFVWDEEINLLARLRDKMFGEAA